MKLLGLLLISDALVCAQDAVRGEWLWALAQAFLMGTLSGVLIVARFSR